MKLFLCFLLFANFCYGQQQRIDLGYNDHNPKREITTGLVFLSGICDGISQTLYAHYPVFQETFPNARAQYWDPSISWKNKYQNGDPLQGERFPGSSSVFVFSTDAYHLFRTLQKAQLIAIGGLEFSDKKSWEMYLLDVAIYSLVYSAGFHLTYSIIFK